MEEVLYFILAAKQVLILHENLNTNPVRLKMLSCLGKIGDRFNGGLFLYALRQ
jgi:hypothetical protein